MAEPGDRMLTPAVLLAACGLLAAVGLGAWWTGLAVADGRSGAVIVRFGVSLAGAWYYLALFRIAQGRPALPGPR